MSHIVIILVCLHVMHFSVAVNASNVLFMPICYVFGVAVDGSSIQLCMLLLSFKNNHMTLFVPRDLLCVLQWERYSVFSLVENHVIETLGSPLQEYK